MPHNDAQVLNKIVEEIDFLAGMLSGVDFEAFGSDEKIKRATAMTVINIGELAKHLSEDFFESHPEAALRNAAKTRDVYAHGYFKLDDDLVFQTATNDIPRSKKAILKALEKFSSPGSNVPTRDTVKLSPQQAEQSSCSQSETLATRNQPRSKTR